jgi:hypothetical protein
MTDNFFRQGQLLLQAQQLVAMNKPPTRDQISVRNYMENRPCLVEDEASFVYDQDDLITLRPGRDHSFVDGFVERLLKRFHCNVLQVNPSNLPFSRIPSILLFLLHDYAFLISHQRPRH